MALYRIRLIWDAPTRIESDRAVWSWGVESATAPVASTLQAAYNASLTLLRGRMGNQWRTIGFAVYPAAGGEAVSVHEFSSTGGMAGSVLPPQIAMVVNAQISTERGVRTKGRTFYSGFAVSDVDGWGRPTGALVNALLSASTGWHNQLVGLGHQPVVLGLGGTVSRGNIVAYSTDNSFDTMRSRKAERTQVTGATP